MTNTSTPKHVFMSYSRKDEAVMRRVVAFLRKEGINVWVDNEDLVPGTPIWEVEIEKAIRGAEAVVVLLSPDSNASIWVRREISFSERYQKRIFPLLIAGDEDRSIMLRLTTSQYVDIRQNEELGLKSLSTALSFYLEDLITREQREKEKSTILIAEFESTKKNPSKKAVHVKEKLGSEGKASHKEVNSFGADKSTQKTLLKSMMRYIPVGIITIAIIGGIWRISQLPDLNVSTPVPTNSEANSDWQGSAHNDETAQAFNSWNDLDPREIPVACARCHSTQGFLDFLGFDRSSKGIVDNPVPAPAGTIACQACHIDNDGSGIHTINEVTFPSGAIVSFGSDDASNICINCHQGRTSKISVDQYINEFNAASEPDLVQTSMTFQNIHYFAAGATLFGTNVKGAYEYDGKTYLGFTPDHRDIRCLDCHDGHSLKIKVEYCQDCHEQISDLRAIRLSVIDYDGDGNITKGIDSEINTLTEDLFIEIQNYAKSHGGAIIYENAVYPFFFDLNGEMYTAWTPRLLKASYNYHVVQKDPGAFSHNPRYIIQLLYDSIQDLGGDTSRFIRP